MALQIYEGTYTDKDGVENIMVENHGNGFSTTIRGVRFVGADLEDFHVAPGESYHADALCGFTFYPITFYESEAVQDTLCNCVINMLVPQTLIDVHDIMEQAVELHISIQLSNPLQADETDDINGQTTISLSFNEQIYRSSYYDFDTILNGLSKQLGPRYRFKNCYVANTPITVWQVIKTSGVCFVLNARKRRI